MPRVSSGLCWLWIAVIVFMLDWASKYFALHHLHEYEPIVITQFFNLMLAFNKGAAFSFLHHASGWQMWFFSGLSILVTMGILGWLKRLSYQQRWLSIALTLIIGGALGNLFDRVYYGHVIDFLQFHLSHFYWPVFNLADSAICVGAFLLFWDVMVKKEEHPSREGT